MAKESMLDKLMAAVSERTAANVVKGRSGSGRKTYIDRVIDSLTEEDGVTPTKPKTRLEIIKEVSGQILLEQLQDAGRVEEFKLTESGDGEFDIMVADINRKVKAQVASAIADNNNSTSISFNEKYKDKWEVVKEGNTISLLNKEA